MFSLATGGRLVGAKVVRGGGGSSVNAALLVGEPAGVVTLSGPVVAPAGTVAWIAVAEVTVKLALNVLNVTAVAPVRFVPLMVSLVPAGQLVGAKLVIVGGGTTVNAALLVAEPPGVVTLSGPDRKTAGKGKRVDLGGGRIIKKNNVLNLTAVAPVRLVPLMVSQVPA